ncbi:MAG: hypothetical protein ACLQDL_04810 [Spirochaetia bacterium]
MRKLLFAAAACAAALALASCASYQHMWDQSAVGQVADLLNSGQAPKLASMSLTPFLVDGEIVLLKSDVASFWDGVVKAGFRVEGAALDQGTPVTAESFTRFANTMEVKSFFSQYVKKDARVLSMTSSNGSHVLLLMRRDRLYLKIIGFKGPF